MRSALVLAPGCCQCCCPNDSVASNSCPPPRQIQHRVWPEHRFAHHGGRCPKTEADSLAGARMCIWPIRARQDAQTIAAATFTRFGIDPERQKRLFAWLGQQVVTLQRPAKHLAQVCQRFLLHADARAVFCATGIKRHIAVDTQGLPHAVQVTTAEVTDRKRALQAIGRCKAGLGRVQSVLTDSGYTGKPFAQGVREALGEHVTVQVAKRSELQTFAVIPKRWVVERSFAWLEKNRRLWKNCGRHINTSLQFVHLAFLALILRRSQTRS